MRQLTIPEYGAIISAVGILLTCAGLYFAKGQFDLSATKDIENLPTRCLQ